MAVWLCPISNKNWKVIKRENIYGVNLQHRAKLAKVEIGDFLIFHVFKKVSGIVSICKVISDITDIPSKSWPQTVYSYRIHIESIPELSRDEQNPIPLSSFLGAEYEDEGITVEPYLRNANLVLINESQYQKLLSIFNRE